VTKRFLVFKKDGIEHNINKENEEDFCSSFLQSIQTNKRIQYFL